MLVNKIYEINEILDQVFPSNDKFYIIENNKYAKLVYKPNGKVKEKKLKINDFSDHITYNCKLRCKIVIPKNYRYQPIATELKLSEIIYNIKSKIKYIPNKETLVPIAKYFVARTLYERGELDYVKITDDRLYPILNSFEMDTLKSIKAQILEIYSRLLKNETTEELQSIIDEYSINQNSFKY